MSASLSSPCHLPLRESILTSHKRVDRRSFHSSHYTDRCLRETDVISAIGPVQLAHPPILTLSASRCTSHERRKEKPKSVITSRIILFTAASTSGTDENVRSFPTDTHVFLCIIYTHRIWRVNIFHSSMHSARVPVARAKSLLWVCCLPCPCLYS